MTRVENGGVKKPTPELATQLLEGYGCGQDLRVALMRLVDAGGEATGPDDSGAPLMVVSALVNALKKQVEREGSPEIWTIRTQQPPGESMSKNTTAIVFPAAYI